MAFCCTLATAQLSISLQITQASCSSNGKIKVAAFGGSGNYTYQLTSTCLNGPLLQQTPVFSNLAPCTYTVLVTDGVSGSTATQNAVIGGNYQSPQLSLACGSCEIEAEVTGGKHPLTYSISTAGLTGPFENNTPPGNPVFSNIMPDSIYWIKVTDACGNIAVEACQSVADNIKGFNYETNASGNLEVTSVNGGNDPYTFTLENSNGTFTNFNGIFPPFMWGCDMKITITDGCTVYSKKVSVKPKLGAICANFADGTASLDGAYSGIPPYTYVCSTPDGNFTFDTPEMSGLPVNSEYYQFQAIDACGNKSDAIYKQIKYPVFKQTAVDCSNTSLSLFTYDGGCIGGFDADSWPVNIECLSCPDIQSGTIGAVGDEVILQGNTPGEWKIALEDGCGDHMICHDTVLLKLTPMCDSLHAELINRFNCDNNTTSDRPMQSSNAFFLLKNASGMVVDSNQAGRFYIAEYGEYTVTLNIPGCGVYTAKTTIGETFTVDPEINIYLSNAVINGACTSVYQLLINPSDGPYSLTGGPNNISLTIDHGNLIGTCRWYSVPRLLPGEYLLSPISHCGVKSINLPAPEFDLQAEPAGSCPGSSIITVSGGYDLEWWEAWADSNQVDIKWPGGLIDRYSVDVVNGGNNSSQSGSPYVFHNIEPGPHTVYLYTFNASCPIDTVEVLVPEAEPLSIEASSGILCDGKDTTTLVIEMLTGKPPFVIEQLDCESLGQVVNTFIAGSSEFFVTGIGLGDYCYRVIDSCMISRDHQFSVQYYQDEVEIIYNCDNTITFKVDSINASFKWLNSSGNIIGNSHRLTRPNTMAGEVFTVQVDIGSCVIVRSVTMPAVNLIPSLEIVGEPYFCQGDTVVLTAVTDADSFSWSATNSQNSTLTLTEEGLYTVTVTNSFGCTKSADFLLQLNQPEVDIEVIGGGNGYGLKCFGDRDGKLLAKPLAGFGPFLFKWSNEAGTPGISGLEAGSYSVTVTDSLGCFGTKTIDLTAPGLLAPQVSDKRPFCFGQEDGLIDVEGWSGGAGDVYVSLNGTYPVPAPVKYRYLPPGTYHLAFRDDNGCEHDTTYHFPQPKELILDLGDDLELALGDSFLMEPFLNFWPVDSFAWRTNDATAMNELVAWCTPVENAYYYLEVWDEFGCKAEDKIQVKVDQTRHVFIPTAFSPNGDGINDFFTLYIRTSAVRRIRSFQVYSRWGEKVFDRTEFQPNNDQLGWDGTLDGRYVMPGVHVWKAEIEFIDGKIEVMTGDVMVVR